MFIRPTNVDRITSGFRTAHRPNHNGTDYAQSGTHEIYASADGRVSRSYRSDSYGECIMILHNINGQWWETVYAHMRTGSREVNEGDKVKQGQAIGIMGSTGHSTGQHLHFELHKGRWNSSKSNAVNPEDYIGKFLVWDGDTINHSSKYKREVEELQQRLVDLGYKLPKYGIDGKFGNETAGVIREFQKDAKIKQDSIPGNQTHKALEVA